MSRKSRLSIRNPRFFKKGAGINSIRINGCFAELIKQKKREIRSLIQEFKNSGIFNYYREIRNSARALFFEVDVVAEKIIELRFIIWTEPGKKYFEYTNSQTAKFVLGVNENIENARKNLLRYLEGIKKGCLVEHLYGLALEELEREGKIHHFYKSGKTEDIKKKDFIIHVLKDERMINFGLQVKSSEEALMAIKNELLKEGIFGSFCKYTGNEREDVDRIKEKIIKIIEAYKKGEIIFI